MKKIISMVSGLVLLSIPTSGLATVKIGNIIIKDDGHIVFPDLSQQGTATLKGDQGVQGIQGAKGDKGEPGIPGSQVTKEAICQTYAAEGLQPPLFCVSKKIIFLTSQTFDGNLGGLTGADQKCQSAATAGGLSGTFKAWLSDSTTSARDRLVQSADPYIRTDGAVVANNWFDLTDGSIKEPILCDEYKECNFYKDYKENANSMIPCAWSGTNEHGYKTSSNCNDWTTNSGISTTAGQFQHIDYYWAFYGSRYCNENLKLYCIEQ